MPSFGSFGDVPTLETDLPRSLTDRFKVGELLGKGSFAEVYGARNTVSGEDVAIKVMDKDHLAKSGAVQEHITSEINTMRRVRHPNVVRLHEVMATKKRIFIVMEHVGAGTLLECLPPGGVDEPLARYIFQQLVSALEYCHSRGVYHRDIKPENILVGDTGGSIKIADFGLSALADTKCQETLLHTVCGTPMYIAPEVLRGQGYDGAAADVWACGIVLFFIVAGKMPFSSDLNIAALYYNIGRCEYQCPPFFSRSLVRLIDRLLCPDPARRITIPEIKKMKWFKTDFKEINFYIGNDERPRSLDEYARWDFDSDSDDDSTMSSEDPSSPVPAAHHCGDGKCMHTSMSAPSLSSLDNDGIAVPVEARMRRPKSLNAFDLISSSPSFNLSGLFDDVGEEIRFLSAASVPKIVSKLEEIAGRVSFMTRRTKENQVSIESRNGQRGALLILARIFELTPEIAMVKVCKKAGDTTEYRQFCEKELKPGLHRLVDGMAAVDGVSTGDSE